MVAVCLSACASAGGDESSDTEGQNDGSDDNGDEGSTGSAPPPGPSADGWKQDYVDGSVRLSCDQSRDEMMSSGAASLAFGDTEIYVGYEQVGDNQNPIVARFDSGASVWCAKHETEGPDGRALGITWDGGEDAYVVYTIVGGGSALDQAPGWLPSYAPGSISGGGPKVSFVGRVKTADGALDAGTFVIAVKSDNKVNSHGPRGPLTVREDGTVEFQGASAHKPIDADGANSMDCTDYPFDSRYIFSSDLSELVCADCTNCNASNPCP